MLSQVVLLLGVLNLWNGSGAPSGGVSGSRENAEAQKNEIIAVKETYDFDPKGPLVLCSFLPMEFLACDPLVNHWGNKTSFDELKYGCLTLNMHGPRYHDVPKGKRRCAVLDKIECYGSRNFLKSGFPCIKYSDQYFLTTLLYSILLGLLGMDRFSLGKTGTAVVKLLSLGVIGVWWIIDIILLISNDLTPEDHSTWNKYV